MLAATCAAIGYDGYDVHATLSQCPAKLQLSQEIDRANNAAISAFKKEHNTSDEVEAFFAVPGDPRSTPAFLQEVETCKNPPNHISLYIGAFVAALGITFIFWALAFILGGSFWRPPRLRNSEHS